MAFNKRCNIERTQSDEDYSAEWEEPLFEDKLSPHIFRDSVPKWASLTRPAVELVANLCQALRYSPEIEFTAYNTLDMFFAKSFTRISSGQQQIDFNWGQEVILKIFNIVMICAKYSCRYAVVPLEEMVVMLQRLSCQCDVKTLKESELHVFMTIDFEIYPPTAFEVVNFVIRKVFQGNNAKVTRLMDICVLLMRFVFLERETILKKVKETGDELSKNIELNECFLAAIVLITGANIVRLNENDFTFLLEALYLHLHLQIFKREVLCFSNVLFELAINENKDNVF